MLLALELLVGDRRAEVHVREDVDRLAEVVVRHVRVVARRLLARHGVEVTASSLDGARDVQGAPRGRSLEEHVLDEVGDSRRPLRLVARAALHNQPHGDALGLARREHDAHPVFQSRQAGSRRRLFNPCFSHAAILPFFSKKRNGVPEFCAAAVSDTSWRTPSRVRAGRPARRARRGRSCGTEPPRRSRKTSLPRRRGP